MSEREEQGLKVTVIGPNLTQAGCAKGGSFHVHATGCADIKRSAAKNGYDFGRYGNVSEIEATSLRDVTELVYPADDFQYDPDSDDYGSYRGDIYVFPCVTIPEKEEAA